MPYEPDVFVVWGVSFLVVVSVAWLALHGWRQGRTLRSWAAERGLPCRRRADPRTAARLRAFRREDAHLVRELDRVREVVDLEHDGHILRCEERLDLTPWSTGTGPPRTRIAAVFPARDDGETYSVFDESGRPTRERAPGLRFSSGSASRRIAARLPDPPHPVSITVADGWALAYLLTPSGAVSGDELDYLARVARRLGPGEAGLEVPSPRPAETGESAGGGGRRRAAGSGKRGRPRARRVSDGG